MNACIPCAVHAGRAVKGVYRQSAVVGVNGRGYSFFAKEQAYRFCLDKRVVEKGFAVFVDFRIEADVVKRQHLNVFPEHLRKFADFVHIVGRNYYLFHDFRRVLLQQCVCKSLDFSDVFVAYRRINFDVGVKKRKVFLLFQHAAHNTRSLRCP